MAEVSKTILNPNPEKNVVESDRLGFTTIAGGTSAAVAVIALLTGVLDWLEGVTVNENIKIALIGLAGAGFIAWAIASTGDVLARAYAAAHVVVNKDAANQPALQVAADKLEPKLGDFIKAYSAAHTPASVAVPPEGARVQLVSLPAPLTVQVGSKSGTAVAALVQADEKVKYLVGLPGERLKWEDDSAVSFPP